MFDGTPQNPQEQCHKSRSTLMSPKECEIVRCMPNQLEMKPDFHALDPEPSCVPHQTRQEACLPLGNARDSDTRLKSRGIPISAQQLEESSMPGLSSLDES